MSNTIFTCSDATANSCGRIHQTRASAEKCCEQRGRHKSFVKEMTRADAEKHFPNWAIQLRETYGDDGWSKAWDYSKGWARWDMTQSHMGRPCSAITVDEIHAAIAHIGAVHSENTPNKKRLKDARLWFLRGLRDYINGPAEDDAVAAPEPQPAADPADDLEKALGVIRNIAAKGQGVDAEEVGKMVTQQVNEAITSAIDSGKLTVRFAFTTPKGREVELPDGEALHAAFPEVSKLVSMNLPVILKGPAGTGKSFLCEQVAKALDLRFASMSLSGGTMEHHFLGSRLPDADGAFRHRTTPFLDCFENGGVVLLDEVDACDENVLLAINNGIANGTLPVPGRDDKPFATKHPDFRLIAAANTFGTGPSAIYVGRNQLDAAFLDRFEFIEVDYDRKLEQSLTGDCRELRERWWSIRDKANKAGLRRVVSTRSLLRAVTKHKELGYSVDDCVKGLVASWTVDERKTVEVN